MNRTTIDEHIEFWAAGAFFLVLGVMVLFVCMVGALGCAARSIWHAGAALRHWVRQ